MNAVVRWLAAVALVLMVSSFGLAQGHLAIPDADLTPENFRTVSAIEAMVVRLRAA